MSNNKKLTVLIDVSTVIIIVAGIAGTIWLFSGQPFPESPLVVIETGSMMHKGAPFGKIGTVDPGDIVISKAIKSRKDVVTYVSGKKIGYKAYGSYGDVIIYKPNGYGSEDGETPIIHRAVIWLEYNETSNSFDIPELGLYNQRGTIDIPGYGYNKITLHINLDTLLITSKHDGFITLGDNNNGKYDQQSIYLESRPYELVKLVKPEWIIGKATGEIPWFGSLKLFFEHMRDPENHPLEIPQDSWICLSISLFVILAIPFSMDMRDILRRRKGLPEPEKWIDKIGRNVYTRIEIIKNLMFIYWPLFIFSLTLLYFFNYLIILLSLIIVANIYTSQIIFEDSVRWNVKGYKPFILLTLLTGPFALTLYYLRIKNI